MIHYKNDPQLRTIGVILTIVIISINNVAMSVGNFCFALTFWHKINTNYDDVPIIFF